jgi:hypothetical protein
MAAVRRRALPVVLAVTLVAVVTAAPTMADSTTVRRVGAAETYAHSLLNCTRTGGFVRADGRCLGRGSGSYSAKRAPLRLHAGISTQVAWPWARAMAVHQFCDHAFASMPSFFERMQVAGFSFAYMGENLGCGSGTGDPRGVVLAVHRMMQAEKRVQGGHWRNIKERGYRSVGIGVAVGNGRTTVVWDFYGKRY